MIALDIPQPQKIDSPQPAAPQQAKTGSILDKKTKNN